MTDLRAQYRTVSAELDQAVLEVLKSGEYVQGRRVAAFEANFAASCGAAEAVAVNSGTSALHLALLALGVGPGDEVITVPMTFVATTAAILYVNAIPVFVDVDPETWTMDPVALERAVTPRTKAIMPVHLHGRLADMDAIMAIARRHRVAVVEDAAQAHGAERHGRQAGTFGDVGCFSFYPGKNLGACGEGGCVVTNRHDLAAAVRQLRDWGQAGKYNHILHGFNFRMDEIQAAVLDVKLRWLPAWTTRRRIVAAHYDEALTGSSVATPGRTFSCDHVYHVYSVRSPKRDKLAEELKRSDIATGMHYPRPVHLQPAYRALGHIAGDFPVSERLAAETLSLPIYPEISTQQVQHICRSVLAASERLNVEHQAV
jgi:dTDP-4-amino-4,6-dideoxygalactose transaminase